MIFPLKKIAKKLSSDITEVPEVFTGTEFASLNGLRAICVTLVLVFHIVLSYKLDFDFYPLAGIGVQFFFVLSGFLITTLLLKEKVYTGKVSLKNFYIRRCLRILPVAYLYLLVVAALKIVFHLQLEWTPIIASFLFVRNFFQAYGGLNHLTGHYWSLAVEEQFYLFFPLIIKKNINLYTYFLLFIIAFSLVIDLPGMHSIWLENKFLLLVSQFFSQFLGIAIGSLFSVLLFKKIIFVAGSFLYKPLLSLLLMAMAVGATFFHTYLTNLLIIVESVAFALIILINIKKPARPNFVFTFLNWKPIQFIGILSFSLYIWQQPFTLGQKYIAEMSFFKQFHSLALKDVLLMIASLSVLFVIACTSYNFYEKRFLKARNKFKEV
ncbi:MAG: acyltransferase [Chitinophagaceae bacterium]